MEIKKSYLNVKQAAEYLGVKPQTLDAYRVRGKGPDFIRVVGRIFYTKRDLRKYKLRRWKR